MRRFFAALAVLALLSACSGRFPVGDAFTSTTSDYGFTFGNITCERELWEESIAEIAEDAVGFETVEEAIDAYRSGDDWRLREDWQSLTQSDTNSTQFLDDGGWVYLDVDLIRFNDTWLVAGFKSCVPPDV